MDWPQLKGKAKLNSPTWIEGTFCEKKIQHYKISCFYELSNTLLQNARLVMKKFITYLAATTNNVQL